MEKSTKIIWKSIGSTAVCATVTAGSTALALNRLRASEKHDNEHSSRDEMLSIACIIAGGVSLVVGCVKSAKLGGALHDAMKEVKR